MYNGLQFFEIINLNCKHKKDPDIRIPDLNKNDSDYKKYISAEVIFKSHYYAFTANPAKFYKGKTVQINGTVTIYRGSPHILLTNKDQIKVIPQKDLQ